MYNIDNDLDFLYSRIDEYMKPVSMNAGSNLAKTKINTSMISKYLVEPSIDAFPKPTDLPPYRYTSLIDDKLIILTDSKINTQLAILAESINKSKILHGLYSNPMEEPAKTATNIKLVYPELDYYTKAIDSYISSLSKLIHNDNISKPPEYEVGPRLVHARNSYNYIHLLGSLVEMINKRSNKLVIKAISNPRLSIEPKITELTISELISPKSSPDDQVKIFRSKFESLLGIATNKKLSLDKLAEVSSITDMVAILDKLNKDTIPSDLSDDNLSEYVLTPNYGKDYPSSWSKLPTIDYLLKELTKLPTDPSASKGKTTKVTSLVNTIISNSDTISEPKGIKSTDLNTIKYIPVNLKTALSTTESEGNKSLLSEFNKLQSLLVKGGLLTKPFSNTSIYTILEGFTTSNIFKVSSTSNKSHRIEPLIDYELVTRYVRINTNDREFRIVNKVDNDRVKDSVVYKLLNP